MVRGLIFLRKKFWIFSFPRFGGPVGGQNHLSCYKYLETTKVLTFLAYCVVSKYVWVVVLT